MAAKRDRDGLGLPPRIFMYTPDQIATLLQVEEDWVRKNLLFYNVREPGLSPKSKLRAINIAPEGESPVWRVTENEFLRYLRHAGVKFYERGYGL